MLRPPIAEPERSAIRHGENTAICLQLVAGRHEQPVVMLRRLLSIPALEYETAHIFVRYAQAEARRLLQADEGPPDGEDTISRLTRAIHQRLQAEAAAKAKAEENARLAELVARRAAP